MPLDPNAVPGLLRALDSDDVYVRIVAAQVKGACATLALRRVGGGEE